MTYQNLILDCNNLYNRTLNITISRNLDSIYSFLTSLKKYATDFPSQKIWAVWDKKLDYPSTNFRKQLLLERGIEYKGTRTHEFADKLIEGETVLRQIFDYLGIGIIYPSRLEADDIIAWLVVKPLKDQNNLILSADQDLMQLCQFEGVHIYQPNKKRIVNKQNFKGMFGYDPDKYIIYKCLCGDLGDNIPGVGGIGKVRATRIIQENLEISAYLNEDQYKIYEQNVLLMNVLLGFEKEPGEEIAYQKQYEAEKEKMVHWDNFLSFCKERGYFKILNNSEEWKRLFVTKKDLKQSIVDIVNQIKTH